jgi:hypothetical protein
MKKGRETEEAGGWIHLGLWEDFIKRSCGHGAKMPTITGAWQRGSCTPGIQVPALLLNNPPSSSNLLSRHSGQGCSLPSTCSRGIVYNGSPSAFNGQWTSLAIVGSFVQCHLNARLVWADSSVQWQTLWLPVHILFRLSGCEAQVIRKSNFGLDERASSEPWASRLGSDRRLKVWVDWVDLAVGTGPMFHVSSQNRGYSMYFR